MPDLTSKPSTASRNKPKQIQDAFPTPPRGSLTNLRSHSSRQFSSASVIPQNGVRPQSTPPDLVNNRYNTQNGRTVGAQSDESAKPGGQPRRLNLLMKKSQYFNDAFAFRRTDSNAKDRVIRDSIILAEISLNSDLGAEKAFLIDLTFKLSEIYRRPPSCIMAIISTKTNMILGGSSEPAYSIMISALPSEIAPTKNKRSTHLIQDFMFDTLNIDPNRGLVRFEAVTEENLATNGVTALQEIERLEKQSKDGHGLSKITSRQKSTSSKSSSAAILGAGSKASTLTSEASKSWNAKVNLEGTNDVCYTERTVPRQKKLKTRKSIMTLFRK